MLHGVLEALRIDLFRHRPDTTASALSLSMLGTLGVAGKNSAKSMEGRLNERRHDDLGRARRQGMRGSSMDQTRFKGIFSHRLAVSITRTKIVIISRGLARAGPLRYYLAFDKLHRRQQAIVGEQPRQLELVSKQAFIPGGDEANQTSARESHHVSGVWRRSLVVHSAGKCGVCGTGEVQERRRR